MSQQPPIDGHWQARIERLIDLHPITGALALALAVAFWCAQIVALGVLAIITFAKGTIDEG